MKKLVLVLISIVTFVSCNEKSTEKTENVVSESTEVTTEIAYQSFGEKISDKGVLTAAMMSEKYSNLKPGDTVDVKFIAEVKSVCQSKGCWMRLDVGDEEAMVKFKDYGFFMPKDIAGDEVVVRGKAFIDEMSVEDQRHFAEDAGKSPDEIAAITESKRTLSFTADGVLIAENQ